MTSARSATTSGSEPLLDRGNRSDGAPLGGRVARLLSERGEQIRLTVREPARALQLDGAEIAVAAGCHDTDEMSAALMGADTVFLVSGRESPNRLDEHKSAVDAVARSRCARDRGADSRRSGPSVCGLVPSRRLVPAMREEVAAATRCATAARGQPTGPVHPPWSQLFTRVDHAAAQRQTATDSQAARLGERAAEDSTQPCEQWLQARDRHPRLAAAQLACPGAEQPDKVAACDEGVGDCRAVED